MPPETLTLLAGAVISLACSYVPGLAPRFEELAPESKRVILLVLLAAVTAGVYIGACSPIIHPYIPYLTTTCDQAGVGLAIRTFFLAAIANQTTYALTKPPDRGFRMWQ